MPKLQYDIFGAFIFLLLCIQAQGNSSNISEYNSEAHNFLENDGTISWCIPTPSCVYKTWDGLVHSFTVRRESHVDNNFLISTNESDVVIAANISGVQSLSPQSQIILVDSNGFKKVLYTSSYVSWVRTVTKQEIGSNRTIIFSIWNYARKDIDVNFSFNFDKKSSTMTTSSSSATNTSITNTPNTTSIPISTGSGNSTGTVVVLNSSNNSSSSSSSASSTSTTSASTSSSSYSSTSLPLTSSNTSNSSSAVKQSTYLSSTSSAVVEISDQNESSFSFIIAISVPILIIFTLGALFVGCCYRIRRKLIKSLRQRQDRYMKVNSLIIPENEILTSKNLERHFPETNFENFESSFPQSTCSICLEELQRQVSCRQLYCEHIFHADCIKLWLLNQLTKSFAFCPNCNRDVLKAPAIIRQEANN